MLDQSTFRPEIWQVICQDATEMDMPTDDESILPVYEPPSRSLTMSSRSVTGVMRIVRAFLWIFPFVGLASRAAIGLDRVDCL